MAGSGGQHDVFAVMSGMTQTEPTEVDEINAQSLPGLDNTNGSPVRLLSVQLVGSPSAVHLLNVRAYNTSQVGYGGGSWEVTCRRNARPNSCRTGSHRLAFLA